jgi:site-specific DNA recombinase
LFGYDKHPETNTYSINEAEAAIIRRIFQLFIDGYGNFSIVRILNAEGVPSPRGKNWTPLATYRIINNPSYKGVEYAFKYEQNEDGKVRFTPPSKKIQLPAGVRPAIIDELTFERAQAQRKSHTGDKRRNDTNPILLRGLVRCGVCGARMSVFLKVDKRKKTVYEYLVYRCPNKNLPGRTCRNRNIFATRMDKAVWNRINQYLSSPDEIENLVQDYLGDKKKDTLSEEIKVAEKQLQKTERGIQRLLTAFRNAEDSLAQQIEKEILAANQEKDTLDRTLRVLKYKLIERQAATLDTEQLKAIYKEFSGRSDDLSIEEKRKVFQAFNLKVVVTNGEIAINISPFL